MMISRKLLAGASALAISASFASAQAAPVTQLDGGGGTLAAKVYRDIFNCYAAKANGIYGTSPGNPATAFYPKSRFGFCSATGKSTALGYEAVGSGAGLSAYTVATPMNFGAPSSTNTIAYINNTFNLLATVPYPEIQFAGSDAYLGGTQTANQASKADGDKSGGDTRAFELPALATPITLPITGAAANELTVTDICNIFSGQVQKTSGGKALNEVVVRADGSGTSFIFSDWLSLNCPSGDGFSSTNGFPSTLPSWAAVFAKFKHAGQLPIVPATGSGGVATEVGKPTMGKVAIGYVSPDYVPPHNSVNEAASLVGGISPIVTQKTVGTSRDQVFKRISTVKTPKTYDSATIGSALNNQLVSPGGVGYPIVGFTFLDTYKCYAASINANLGTPTQGKALRAALQFIYPKSLLSPVSKILGGQGFDPVLQSTAVYALLSNSAKGSGPFTANGIQSASCPNR